MAFDPSSATLAEPSFDPSTATSFDPSTATVAQDYSPVGMSAADEAAAMRAAPEFAQNLGQVTSEVALEQVPKTLSELAQFTPIGAAYNVGKQGLGFISDVIQGKGLYPSFEANAPGALEARQAIHTPPMSPERIRAAEHALIPLAMAAGIIKAIPERPSLTPATDAVIIPPKEIPPMTEAEQAARYGTQPIQPDVAPANETNQAGAGSQVPITGESPTISPDTLSAGTGDVAATVTEPASTSSNATTPTEGVTNAQQESGATRIPSNEVRPGVDEKASLRQQRSASRKSKKEERQAGSSRAS